MYVVLSSCGSVGLGILKAILGMDTLLGSGDGTSTWLGAIIFIGDPFFIAEAYAFIFATFLQFWSSNARISAALVNFGSLAHKSRLLVDMV